MELFNLEKFDPIQKSVYNIEVDARFLELEGRIVT